MFLAITVLTATAAFTLTRNQRDTIDETTAHFERELGALARLQREILRAEIPIGGVLYELQREGPMAEQWTRWQTRAGHVERYFRDLRAANNAAERRVLRDAERAWSKVVVGVSDAHDMWGTGEVAAALATGRDPFGPTVWASLATTQNTLASHAVTSVDRVRASSAEAAARQRFTDGLLAVLIGISVLVGLFTARRISRRVIRPLLALQAFVAALRDNRPVDPPHLPAGAGREVAELTSTVTDMAAKLNDSHTRLRAQAFTDGLTGLANRRAFNDELARAFADEDNLAVLLIDVDDFKYVNDSLGHAAGDQLLVAIAGRLQAAVREADTVARVGGDEFAIVLCGADAFDTARRIADRALHSLREPIAIAGAPITIGCSIGIADRHLAGSAEQLLHHADGAMYMAKSRGKNCFELFDPTLHASINERGDIKQQLRNAAPDGQLEVHYQPVMDFDTETVLGFEALVRWRHPTRGLLPPGEFIDIAEETGDIVAIRDWVIDRACQDLARYQATADEASLWVAVNISARQLLSDGLVPTVNDALARHRIAPNSLILEITESSFLPDTERASAVLHDLRAHGVRIAIDDFGVGFSSLAYLTRLPLDVLKIDRSFVVDDARTNRDAVVLQAIVAIAEGLGLDVIAEGIEHHTELDRLRGLGAKAGQGYLFARPMTLEDTLAMIHADHAAPVRQLRRPIAAEAPRTTRVRSIASVNRPRGTVT